MKTLTQDMKKIHPLITDRVEEQFEIYREFLVEYNQKVNLTGITEPQEIKEKHFLDSIILLEHLDIPQGATLIDVGTGAGFPGVPLKIVRPDIRLTLLDSLNKRLIFLEELSEKLDIDAKIIHGRAENVGLETPFRDGYDVVVSRAVSNMSVLSEYCIPFVEPGGVFVAYKGPDIEQELETAKTAIKTLGGKTSSVESFELSDGQQRTLIFIDKLTETPDKYPRQRVNIARNPIK